MSQNGRCKCKSLLFFPLVIKLVYFATTSLTIILVCIMETLMCIIKHNSFIAEAADITLVIGKLYKKIIIIKIHPPLSNREQG